MKVLLAVVPKKVSLLLSKKWCTIFSEVLKFILRLVSFKRFNNSNFSDKNPYLFHVESPLPLNTHIHPAPPNGWEFLLGLESYFWGEQLCWYLRSLEYFRRVRARKNTLFSQGKEMEWPSLEPIRNRETSLNE